MNRGQSGAQDPPALVPLMQFSPSETSVPGIVPTTTMRSLGTTIARVVKFSPSESVSEARGAIEGEFAQPVLPTTVREPATAPASR